MNSFQKTEFNTFGLRVWGGHIERVYPPHYHNEIELNAIEHGFFTYMLAGQQTTISAGEVALFWGAIPHQVIRFESFTQVHWGTVPLDHILRWELPRPFLLSLLSGKMFSQHQPLYGQRFFRQWESDMATGQQALALMEIKALFFRFAQAVETDSFQVADAHPTEIFNERAHRMAQFMSTHFQEELIVNDIAAVVGLHPTYAMRIFRETFGLSLIDYLTQQRIAYAQQQLIITEANISDIALDSGFQTLSHFYNTFHRLCGMAPGQYRASVRG